MDVIAQWLTCASNSDGTFKGDFIVIDVRNFNRQGTWPVDPFAANEVFEQIAARVRGLLESHGRALPIWAAEWYSVSPKRLNALSSAALQMSGLRSLALGGYTKAPLWYPEGDRNGLHNKQGRGTSGLWTRHGAAATRLADYFREFTEGFPPGSALYETERTSGASEVQVLAGEHRIMLINTRDKVAQLTVNSKRFSLRPYEVRFIETTSVRSS